MGSRCVVSFVVLTLSALIVSARAHAVQQAPCLVTVFCPSQTNSLGCSPRIDYEGCPSASASSGFTVSAKRVRNQKVGVLLYDVTGVATAKFFQGGVLCLKQPVFRTPARSTGGDHHVLKNCTGGLRIDMNAFAAGKFGGPPLPALQVPGTIVACQWWSHDPGDPFGSNLTNALRYEIGP